MKNTLFPAPAKQIALRQDCGFTGRLVKGLPPEIGPPREITFSTPTTCLQGIGRPTGFGFPRLVIAGLKGTVQLRKNVWVSAVLNNMTLEIDPARNDAGGPLALERLRLPNVPTVNGAQPQDWDYEFGIHIGGETAVLSIRLNAVALRAANCGSGLDVLGTNEELVMAAPAQGPLRLCVTDSAGNTYRKDAAPPSEGLIVAATPDSPSVSAEITAMFLLRDCSS
jgi:hypothetical protein